MLSVWIEPARKLSADGGVSRRASIRWLVVSLVISIALFTASAQGYRKPAALAVSSPEGGVLEVCRDGIVFQVASDQTTSPPDPNDPGPTEPFSTHPFEVYSPLPEIDPGSGTVVLDPITLRPIGGTIVAEGIVPLRLQSEPFEADGSFYWYLGTHMQRWSGGRLLAPRARSLFLDVYGDRSLLLNLKRNPPYLPYDIEECFLFTAKASIDIKPGTAPNSVAPRGHGRIPVAILTTPNFDATRVDRSRVRFGTSGTEARAVESRRRDVDADGDKDMVLRFKVRRTGIRCGDTSASLTGHTVVGQPLQGSDMIKTVQC